MTGHSADAQNGRPQPVTVAILVGSPQPASRTRALADEAVDALIRHQIIQPRRRDTLELGELVTITVAGRPARRHQYPAVADPFETVRTADLVVVATPSVAGTFTGLLKAFLDEIAGLPGTVAIAAAVAMPSRSHSHAGPALDAVLTELGASTPAPPLIVNSGHDQRRGADDWARRHRKAIADALANPRRPA
ncbi:NADPH-dependent FMN reductase [Actinoplanes sp. NPDC000266]